MLVCTLFTVSGWPFADVCCAIWHCFSLCRPCCLRCVYYPAVNCTSYVLLDPIWTYPCMKKVKYINIEVHFSAPIQLLSFPRLKHLIPINRTTHLKLISSLEENVQNKQTNWSKITVVNNKKRIRVKTVQHVKVSENEVCVNCPKNTETLWKTSQYMIK